VLKWIVGIIAGIIALVVLAAGLLAGLPWLPVITESSGAQRYRTWLAENSVVLDPSTPGMGMELAQEHLDARYILLGEMHGYAFPQALDAALITYLQSAGPARWYLAELTPREAIAVNLYISGGDDAAIRTVFDRFAQLGLQWANREFFAKLTALRALNETLPAERQIQFIGIDLDRSGDPLVLPAALAESAPDLANPASSRAINAALLVVQPDVRSRYAAMKARMTALAGMPGFDDARFAGLWGLGHASEVTINGYETMAQWLQDPAADYAGDVVTINTLCVGECFNMMPAAALPEPMQGPAGEAYTWIPMGIENPYFQRPAGIGDLMNVLGENRAALFRINGEGTPYADGGRLTDSSGYLVMMQPWEYGGSAAEMTDYYISYRGTAPLTPWAGEAFDITGQAAAALGGTSEMQ